MKGSDKFIESLVSSIAKEVVQSSIIQHEVANAIKDNPKLLQAVIDGLDVEVLSKYLAQRMVTISKKPGSWVYTDEVKQIMRDAKREAKLIITRDIANQIRSDTEGA